MQPVSIMGKHLNNFERLSILEDYLSGSDSKVAIEQKYGLSHGLIRSWLSKFGLEDKVHPVPMKVSQSPQSELPLNEKEELEQLRKENRVLKSRLKREEPPACYFLTLPWLATALIFASMVAGSPM